MTLIIIVFFLYMFFYMNKKILSVTYVLILISSSLSKSSKSSVKVLTFSLDKTSVPISWFNRFIPNIRVGSKTPYIISCSIDVISCYSRHRSGVPPSIVQQKDLIPRHNQTKVYIRVPSTFLPSFLIAVERDVIYLFRFDQFPSFLQKSETPSL